MASAPRPAGSRLQDSRILVFDTETTGVDVERDRVVEVGVTLFEGGVETRVWHSRVNPGCPVPPEASAVHGLRDEDLAGAPSFAEIAPTLLGFLQGEATGGPVQLCGYNALSFDAPLLNHELARAGLAARVDPASILDPVYFARWHHRGLRNRNLGGMCEHYRIGLDGAHSVAADTRATGALLLRMAEAGLIPGELEAALAEQARLREEIEGEFRRYSYWLYGDRQDGRLRLGASRHCGSYLEDVDADHLRYLLAKIPDLPAEVRLIFEGAVHFSSRAGAAILDEVRGGGTLQLELAAEAVTADRLALLRGALGRHPGAVAVALVLRSARWSVEARLPPRYRVAPSLALLRSLQLIPGVRPLPPPLRQEELFDRGGAAAGAARRTVPDPRIATPPAGAPPPTPGSRRARPAAPDSPGRAT